MHSASPFVCAVSQRLLLQLPLLVEQLSAFARASIVIGPHGAGETWLFVSPPGTRVVEIMDTREPNLCYLSLSALLRLKHATVGSTEGSVSVSHIDEAVKALRDA